jgi:uncharacterized protein with von Willebrand factor type A (vWA) domain
MERLKSLLDEQKKRHEGGSKWIGTGGTSPFGNGGYHPEGIRIGDDTADNRTAVTVWESRAYRNYNDQLELGTRNIKVALRRLRRFARDDAAEELDLPDTIRSTAANAGWLDIKMVPEHHNNVKVLMLLNVGDQFPPPCVAEPEAGRLMGISAFGCGDPPVAWHRMYPVTLAGIKSAMRILSK